MDISIFFAQFWGWLLIILGLIFLLRGQALIEELASLLEEKDFRLVSGYLALTLGLATVILHNLWVSDWRVIITVFGWLGLVKGVVRIGFPGIVKKMIPLIQSQTTLMRLLLLVMVLLGAYLVLVS